MTVTKTILTGLLSQIFFWGVTGLYAQSIPYFLDSSETVISESFLSTINGTVWYDNDPNGYPDLFESGLENILIQLDSGKKTQTDSNGLYQFSDLEPGAYTVSIATPSWFQTWPCMYDTNEFYTDGAYFINGQTTSDSVDSRSVIHDPDGNMYYSGLFQGTVDFDPSDQMVLKTASGKAAVFVTKFDTAMTHLWTVVLPTVWGSTSKQIALNPENEILVSYDGSLVKLNPQGEVIWTKEFRNGSRPLSIKALAVAPDGSLYLTGVFDGTNDFNPGMETDVHVGEGFVNQFVTKLNADDSYAWTKITGQRNAIIEPTAITVDSLQRVTVAGYYRGTVKFDPPANTEATYTSRGDYDCYLVQLDAEGSFLWAKSIGGAYWDKAFDVSTDLQDQIYVTGAYSNWVNFNPDDGEDRFYTPFVNIGEGFLTKFTAQGEYVWTMVIPAEMGRTAGMAVRIDPLNRIWLLGESLPDEPALRSDLFLAQIDTLGQIQTTYTFTSVIDAVLPLVSGIPAFRPWTWNLSMSPSGDWLITGQLSGNVTIDMGGMASAIHHHSQGEFDGFILKLKRSDCTYTLDLLPGESAINIDFGLVSTQQPVAPIDPNTLFLP